MNPIFPCTIISTLLVLVPLRATEVWKLDNLEKVGGHPTTVIGGAHVARHADLKAAHFDGFDDAILVHSNPVEGLSAFTIEVLICPAPDGMAEQRFVHIQQHANSLVRIMIETRLAPDGQWCLDTALFSPTSNHVLIDRTKLHPANRWAWVALRYDGNTISNFVNGELESQGEMEFPPMKAGQTTIGVRHNLVSWYKGAIREVRIHPTAVPQKQLNRRID